MNTLESMLARQARHKTDAAWHARARKSAELNDHHHPVMTKRQREGDEQQRREMEANDG